MPPQPPLVDPAAVERELAALRERCRSGGVDEQLAALRALRALEVKEAISPAVELLGSPDAGVRAEAVRTLEHLGAFAPGEVGSPLTAALADAEPLVRAMAVDALGVVGHAAAAPRVRDLLGDPDALVRAAAAETLGDLRDRAAAGALLAALRDEDAPVRGYAANALGLVGGPALLPELQRALEAEASPAVRAELHGARLRLGSAADLAPLVELISSAGEDVADNLLNLLGDLATRDTPEAFAGGRESLREALARLGSRWPSLKPQIARVERLLGPPPS